MRPSQVSDSLNANCGSWGVPILITSIGFVEELALQISLLPRRLAARRDWLARYRASACRSNSSATGAGPWVDQRLA